MGTRHFSRVEEADSRIKWEQADADVARKLAAAINKKSLGLASAKVARVVVFLPGIILLELWAGFTYLLISNFLRIVGTVEIIFYIIGGAALVFSSIFLLTRYIKFRPYLYPERQPDIWTFRAKCSGIRTSGQGSDKLYYADFQKGGVHICIRLQAFEYKANPTGKEYIFFKFNNRTGNRWTAIPADRLTET